MPLQVSVFRARYLVAFFACGVIVIIISLLSGVYMSGIYYVGLRISFVRAVDGGIYCV